ncbi:hypothetical protein N7501_010234 [Penicillium viridicatum]|nr:hypothetical protein N7501_010234 [Penicillium viridicatum]
MQRLCRCVFTTKYTEQRIYLGISTPREKTVSGRSRCGTTGTSSPAVATAQGGWISTAAPQTASREDMKESGVQQGYGNWKRPDWGWGPIRRCDGPKRPGVVVVSENATKLRNDAVMWVDPVKGQANMAITIKVDHTNPRFTLDTYEWNSRTQCAHVTQSCVIEENTKITVSQ